MTTTAYIGQAISRIDARVKVTGQAKYAGEYNVPNLAYGVVVSAAIAKGRIKKIDTREALALEGVLHVFTHKTNRDSPGPTAAIRTRWPFPALRFAPFTTTRSSTAGSPPRLSSLKSLKLRVMRRPWSASNTNVNNTKPICV